MLSTRRDESQDVDAPVTAEEEQDLSQDQEMPATKVKVVKQFVPKKKAPAASLPMVDASQSQEDQKDEDDRVQDDDMPEPTAAAPEKKEKDKKARMNGGKKKEKGEVRSKRSTGEGPQIKVVKKKVLGKPGVYRTVLVDKDGNPVRGKGLAGKAPGVQKLEPGHPKYKKPHRWRPGTVALREIRRLQKSTDLIIPKAPYYRLVKEILQEARPDIRITREAMVAMQEGCEDLLVNIFNEAQTLVSGVARKVTLNRLPFIMSARKSCPALGGVGTHSAVMMM